MGIEVHQRFLTNIGWLIVSKIGYIDGTATGNILGFEDIYRYDVCKACFKKVNGEKNGNCIGKTNF